MGILGAGQHPIHSTLQVNDLLRGCNNNSRFLQQCPFPIDPTKSLVNVIGPLR